MRSDMQDPKDDFTRFVITRRIELHFWKNCAIIGFGILAASYISGGAISFANIFSYAALVVAVWLFNFIIRPVLVVFTLPFIVLTFGVGMLFINALVIWIAAGLIPGIKFTSYFWALLAAFITDAVFWLVAMFESERTLRKNKKRRNGDDEAIDI
ncbi:MAG: phage holin family protein [Opitutales bacterium]|nr:phage holin family protein [Opitutales bacterium]